MLRLKPCRGSCVIVVSTSKASTKSPSPSSKCVDASLRFSSPGMNRGGHGPATQVRGDGDERSVQRGCKRRGLAEGESSGSKTRR
ncbi:hypothetical protein FA15DRAFT_259426 [Coprinopsis marcescibilis]|uniref:Uncharacterized protein n=1 Tax=Coprinopsis marcescibilis TaxID=230819 RepID=A0A5C3L1I6_COPMA|nr:hypothetical protein FA15DRAFT_259426 [Coprinopsis marcescibilis]